MRRFVLWGIGIAAFVGIVILFGTANIPDMEDQEERIKDEYDLVDFENPFEYEDLPDNVYADENGDLYPGEGYEWANPDNPDDLSVRAIDSEPDVSGSITVSPNPATLVAPVCFSEPCEVDTKFTVTASGPWYIDAAFSYATKECGDAPGGSYWSICPTSGGAGTTDVIIRNRVYGVATPDYYDELLTDGFAKWTLRLDDDWYTSVNVEAWMKLSKA